MEHSHREAFPPRLGHTTRSNRQVGICLAFSQLLWSKPYSMVEMYPKPPENLEKVSVAY